MAKKEWEIIVTVDTNDADYITEVTAISDEHLEKIKPLIKAIQKQTKKDKWGHNYGNSEYCDEIGSEQYPEFDEEIHELFKDICPYGEHGFHTVESIEVQPYVKKVKLL